MNNACREHLQLTDVAGQACRKAGDSHTCELLLCKKNFVAIRVQSSAGQSAQATIALPHLFGEATLCLPPVASRCHVQCGGQVRDAKAWELASES